MKKLFRMVSLAICIAMLCCACGDPDAKTSPGSGTPVSDPNASTGQETPVDMPYVGIVLKSTDNPYFALIKAGAEDEADALGVQVMVFSPDAESDVQGQADMVSTMANMAVDVIVVAPTNEKSLSNALEQAVDRGKIVMSVDTPMDFEDCACYIGSDQYNGGYQQGKYAAELVSESDNAYAVILRGAQEDKAHTLREYGITDALEDGNVYVLGAEDCGGEEAQAEQTMTELLEEHPELNVVCTTSDSMAVGAQRAVANAERKDIHIVSFDGLPEALELVRIGELDATFAQDPYEMGRKCIEYAVKLYNGETVEESYHTDVKRITSGNAAAQADQVKRQLNHEGGK
ncbi:MAG: sugar ABC transporter substrate-binding protein [Eubacteriales bacterium]|nr:sugar ABC transporter substrate-binding protein [Eubacteriales bacterium]